MTEPDATQPFQRIPHLVGNEEPAFGSPAANEEPALGSFDEYLEETKRRRPFTNVWLHVLLLVATFLTTTVFGFALVECFSLGRAIDLNWVIDGYLRLAHGNRSVLMGVSFSLPLLAILLAHEAGHNIAAIRSNIDASLPYFLPFPSLFGTLGAFIRIRSPIYSRRSLFDVGVSGPIIGFVLLIPFLIAGLALSRIHAPAGGNDTFSFGTPLLLRWAEHMRFPGVPLASISLHPMAMAAWVGLFSTAINLLPIGQLDGGHILYAVVGERWHRITSNALIGMLAIAGFFYSGWWVWAVLLFFFGRRHPLIYDKTPLGGSRLFLSGLALLLFILSVSLVPVSIR